MIKKIIQYLFHAPAPRYRSVLRLLYILLIISVFIACTQERQPCLTPKRASLNLRFVHFAADSSIVTNNFTDTSLPRAIFTSLGDSGNLSTLYLAPTAYYTISLSPVTDSCKWQFIADSTSLLSAANFDTLSFYYKRKLQFLSNACGYTDFYSIDSVRTTKIHVDSVIITNTSVTNDVNTKHLKIFMHPGF